VRDDDDVVARHPDIEFDRRDADRERRCEAGQRVLGREPPRAAVSLEVDAGGRAGDEDRGREQRPSQGQISSSLKK
jgi:hypothetical protein